MSSEQFYRAQHADCSEREVSSRKNRARDRLANGAVNRRVSPGRMAGSWQLAICWQEYLREARMRSVMCSVSDAGAKTKEYNRNN
ncbi:hypothetical protein EVAR_5209_1 [Eumeta japonica]|uniref:Uncharacterized protein n=1 Tax=Eumeta variegata TaxID=151549 RepID=A0A4C1V4U3_EUMVA|nr:hypothetical protein EVAR_5209_1 [Eumeta japonica]